MPKRIFIRDGGLTSSVPTPVGYTVIGANGGIPKKQVISTISNISRPYRVYSALLSQSLENPPVATVLENTIGDINWEYFSVGMYRANLTGEFTIDKTFCQIQNFGTNTGIQVDLTLGLPDYIIIGTFNNFGMNNNILSNCSIEIRIYS